MTRPTMFLIRMFVFIAIVLAVTALLGGELLVAFNANPLLNALILAVLLGGIAWNLRQVVRLTPEVPGWRLSSAIAPASPPCRRRSCWHRWSACWPPAAPNAPTALSA